MKCTRMVDSRRMNVVLNGERVGVDGGIVVEVNE